jgi:hypothetical protein
VFSGLSALQRLRQRTTRLRVRLDKAYAGFNDREGPRFHRGCTCSRFPTECFAPLSRRMAAEFSTSYRWDSIRCEFVLCYSQSLIDGTVGCNQWNTLL